MTDWLDKRSRRKMPDELRRRTSAAHTDRTDEELGYLSEWMSSRKRDRAWTPPDIGGQG